MGLTAEQALELLGSARKKGVYVEKLNEFLSTGQAGVSVKEEWSELAGKKTQTLKQGFDAAREKKEAADGADKVRVVVNEEQVYLVNLAAPGMIDEPTEAEAEVVAA